MQKMENLFRSQLIRYTVNREELLVLSKERKFLAQMRRCVGTITSDRLVYRSTESASISSPFSAANRVGATEAHRVGSAIWREEPNIPN